MRLLQFCATCDVELDLGEGRYSGGRLLCSSCSNDPRARRRRERAADLVILGLGLLVALLYVAFGRGGR